MSKCPQCPVKDGPECLGSEMPNEYGYFCQWAGDGCDIKRRTIVNRTRIGGSGGRGCDETPIAVTPAVSANLALLARMRSCPHWVKRADCGCGTNECKAGKGKAGLVSHADCLECLSATAPPVDPVEPS
jgi:hypothetical protein